MGSLSGGRRPARRHCGTGKRLRMGMAESWLFPRRRPVRRDRRNAVPQRAASRATGEPMKCAGRAR
ncbi:Hypothetical protein SmN45_2010 [Serratia marcescens]|nr:Hypothetical protein SmN45_2010 [Serratia marcescens]